VSIIVATNFVSFSPVNYSSITDAVDTVSYVTDTNYSIILLLFKGIYLVINAYP
jgi:hypothetical protein